MLGRKKFNDFYDDDLFLGNLELEKQKEEKAPESEADPSDEIAMEHSDKPQLIKEKGAVPKRRPLANPEAMPKDRPKKKTSEKKKPAFTESRPDKKGIFPFTVIPVKKVEEKAPPKPLTKEEKEKQIRDSLDGLYDVYKDPDLAPDKRISPTELWRYAVLFVCIFGFFAAGIFVFGKIYSYHRTYVINTQLQELVSSVDRFQNEYLKKNAACVNSLTPQDILNGKKEETTGGDTYTEKQQNLVNKLHQLKKINGDTAGWITVSGTVVNYPVVWSEVKNYYLKHDFYGKTLASGTIYIDERNSPLLAENRNTVIYGHNMSDGSMFASLHDFSSSTLFHSATIEIATTDGIYVYKPFSAHESDAYDNYFETDFASDEDFLTFCEQMSFLSLHQTDTQFDKDTRLLTLSTCKNEGGSRDRRFAVHAVLVKVIR